MRKEETVLPPVVPWQAGWILRPSAWAHPHFEETGTPLCTLDAVAEIGPPQAPPAWSLHIGPPGAFLGCPVRLLADGFQIEAAMQGGPDSICLLDADGTVWGHTTCPTPPYLFSAEREVTEDGNACWVDTEAARILLLRRQTDGGTRFALVRGAHDHELLLQTAEAALARDAQAALDDEFRRRSAFWHRHHPPPARAQLVTSAVETLVRNLRPARGPFPHRWSAAPNPAGGELFDVNQVYPLVLAWNEIDPRVAQDLILSALARQEDDGEIPATCHPDGSASENEACRPLLAQAALAAWSRTHDPDFLQAAAPRLHAFLAWALRHFDPDGRGIHRWRSAEEALVPETFDMDVAAPDVTSFLLAEIEALSELAGHAEGLGSDFMDLSNEHDRLMSSLLAGFWDAGEKCFLDAHSNGEHTSRVTLASLTPLLCLALERIYREALLKEVFPPGRLARPLGVAAWEPWAQDGFEAPVRPLHQVLVLEALRRHGLTDAIRRLGAILWSAVSAPTNRGLESSGDSVAAAAATAALVVCLQALSDQQEPSLEDVPRSLALLDRHRMLVLGGAVVAFVVAVLAVAFYSLSKTTLTMPTFEALSGLAQRHYAEGRYEEAVRLYEEISRTARGAAPIETMLGNSFFRLGDYGQAERHYREALAKDPNAPAALVNLGLTLYHQGRLDEARACYQQAVELHGTRMPVVRHRAATALMLIDQMVASAPAATE
ncbi:MAG: tetratricopeptide repeat protein [Kiritimatiellae bacterium]|nr:tetratricopeptide repeat protein [Kiritimatiellia bacterium]